MPDHSLFRLRGLPWYIALAITGCQFNAWADDTIQFDPRFLELKGDTKIDLGRFSHKGYVEPGKYNLCVLVNKQPLPNEYDIYWYAAENDASKSYACLTPELVALFGLKDDIAKALQWTYDGQCLKSGQLDGMTVEGDLSQSALVISLPQAYLEYADNDWDPPSRWDDGIPGLIADYSINAQTRHQEDNGENNYDVSGNVLWAPTLAHGVCAPTGKATISTLAIAMIKAATVRKEAGSGAVITPGAHCRP